MSEQHILSRRASDIDEASLQALEKASVPESIELEYKAQLNIDARDDKREASKDVSAMANTAGGRLLYGVSESQLNDGTKVAGPLTPLTRGTALEDLANVLATTIHPRPLFTFQRVEVTGGFVLVVDVRPSPTDVYMVSGYGEGRYYRRGPNGVIRMTEPEVRQAYERASTTREKLESRERELIATEVERRKNSQESILIFPVLSSASMIDPKHLGALKSDIKAVLAYQYSVAEAISHNLSIEADGCRSSAPERSESDSYLYFAALKTGLIHWSSDAAFGGAGELYDFSSSHFLSRLLGALELARRIHERASYHGPVRVHYILRGGPFSIDRNPHGFYHHLPTVPAGVHRSGPVDAYLSQRGYSRIAKQLLDPLLNALGEPSSPMFDDAGAARPSTRESLPQVLADLLD